MRQIQTGLNTVEGVYLHIGTAAFRTTEENKIISCRIGKGSNPWKYKYFTTRDNGNKYLNKEEVVVKETVVEVETKPIKELANYDKNIIIGFSDDLCNQRFETYGQAVTAHSTYEGRQKHLDHVNKIKFTKELDIKDFSDIFFHLIMKRHATSNCHPNRARTADDLYLLARYQYNMDITFEECFKILFIVIKERKLFSPNFTITTSWCSTVHRIVTSPNFPQDKTQEDFRQFFNTIKCNRLINE